MASVQCQKPSEQVQSSTNYPKTTTAEACHYKNKNSYSSQNEHSFTDKVKEMAHSARKMFRHQSPVTNHVQKPASNNSSTGDGGVKMEKEKKKKKKIIMKRTEGQEGHCMPKMLDHMKNKNKTKKNKNKDGKHRGGSSDSGSSSSESENEH